MRKQTRRGHTMLVPEWIWAWAQAEYDVLNPASRLGDVLAEAVSNIKTRKTIVPRTNDQGHKDKGHPFKASRPGICETCGKVYEEGITIVACEGKYFHTDCFNKIKGQWNEMWHKPLKETNPEFSA